MRKDRRNEKMTNNINEIFDKTGKIITWMNERLPYLPADEQLILVANFFKMVEEISPIYERDLKRIEDESTKIRKDKFDLLLENLLKKRGDNE